MSRRTQIEESDRSCEFAPELQAFAIVEFRRSFDASRVRRMGATLRTHHDLRSWRPEIALRPPTTNGIVCAVMNALRELRRAIGLGQREFAALVSIPLETFRPWDSGRRVVSLAVRQRAREVVAHRQRQNERLPLDRLAKELHVHVRTLQAAVLTGRLDAHFSVKSVLGRPRRLATREAAERFMAAHYRRFAGQQTCPSPLC